MSEMSYVPEIHEDELIGAEGALIPTEIVDLTDGVESEPETGEALKEKKNENGLCYDDLVLPTTTITKLIKDVLPDKSIISKEAKDMARRIGVFFILYVTDCALEYAAAKKRKTVSGDDILIGLKELDFEDMSGILRRLLSRRKSKEPTAEKIVTSEPEFSVESNEVHQLETADNENGLDGHIDHDQPVQNNETLQMDDIRDEHETEPVMEVEDRTDFNRAFTASDDEQ